MLIHVSDRATATLNTNYKWPLHATVKERFANHVVSHLIVLTHFRRHFSLRYYVIFDILWSTTEISVSHVCASTVHLS